jgi:hypothetical protein
VVIVGAPFETEDLPPTFANLVTVDGGTDALTINLFYVHPTKITRLLNSPDPAREGNGVRTGDIVRIPSEPVARLAISMNTAADLMVALFRCMAGGSTGLREELLPVAGARMGAMARLIGLGDIFSPPQDEENDE